MTTEKFIAFMEKLLDKTKDGSLQWTRYSPNMSSENEYWASELKSFSCIAGTMQVVMLCDEDFSRMQFDVRYDSRLPWVSLKLDSDKLQQMAMRLASYVYDQFPNLENSIDRFLNEP